MLISYDEPSSSCCATAYLWNLECIFARLLFLHPKKLCFESYIFTYLKISLSSNSLSIHTNCKRLPCWEMFKHFLSQTNMHLDPDSSTYWLSWANNIDCVSYFFFKVEVKNKTFWRVNDVMQGKYLAQCPALNKNLINIPYVPMCYASYFPKDSW